MCSTLFKKTRFLLKKNQKTYMFMKICSKTFKKTCFLLENHQQTYISIKQIVPRPTKHTKTLMESAQKRPSAKKQRANSTRGSKNIRKHHSRAAGAQKTQNGPQKKREKINWRQRKHSDSPDSCVFPIRTKRRVPTRKNANVRGAKCTKRCARWLPPDGRLSSKNLKT